MGYLGTRGQGRGANGGHSRRRARRFAAVLCASILLLPLAAAALAGATGQTITAPIVINTTVGDGAHDTFTVTAPAGGRLSVSFRVTGGENVDVWVFTASQLADYEDPSVMWFGYEAVRENTKSWSGTIVSNGATRYFVVDNEYVSESGANPSGPVQYTAEFTNGDVAASSALFAILGVVGGLIVLALVVGAVSRRRSRARAQIPLSALGGAGYGAQLAYGQQNSYGAQYAGQYGTQYAGQYGEPYGYSYGTDYNSQYSYNPTPQPAYGSPTAGAGQPQRYDYSQYGYAQQAPPQPVYAQYTTAPQAQQPVVQAPATARRQVVQPPQTLPNALTQQPQWRQASQPLQAQGSQAAPPSQPVRQQTTAPPPPPRQQAPQSTQPPRPPTAPPSQPARQQTTAPSPPQWQQAAQPPPLQRPTAPQQPPPPQPQGPQPPRKPPYPPGG